MTSLCDVQREYTDMLFRVVARTDQGEEPHAAVANGLREFGRWLTDAILEEIEGA